VIQRYNRHIRDVSRIHRGCQAHDERGCNRVDGLDVLALGTFTAGIHILAWRLCLVGIVLGLGVPSIAWFEERTLLVFLLAFIAAAAVVTFFVIDRKLAAWTGKSKSAF
jgi:hypothetical protein